VKRIVIIGPGGAGKSTLALQLGAVLDLPVIHLDRELWQPGWVITPRDSQVRLQAEMVTGDRWIIDGNYGATLQIRLTAADTVLFLDLHPLRCLWRVFKRSIRYRGRTRPDMGPGCLERWPNREFLTWIATYRRRKRPAVRQMLGQLSSSTDVHELRSPRQVRHFLKEITLRHALGEAALAAALNERARFG
jgi:adenylate kinase family enzyme